ncbi:MAG: hypothetical protein QW756_08405 [Nitrososphaerota archaeon]
MKIKNLTLLVFTALAALSPLTAYLSWRSGIGQPTSSLLGLLVFLAAIIFVAVASNGRDVREI